MTPGLIGFESLSDAAPLAMSSEGDQHVIRAIVGLAQGFGLQTIGEGVEDEATLELLREFGVDHAQGFHLGRPAPL